MAPDDTQIPERPTRMGHTSAFKAPRIHSLETNWIQQMLLREIRSRQLFEVQDSIRSDHRLTLAIKAVPESYS